MHLIEVHVDRVFQALSDFSRVRIIRLLAITGEEICLCELSRSLEEPESKLSRHVKILKQAGLITTVKEGKWVYHSLVKSPEFFSNLEKTVLSISDGKKIFSLDLKRFKKGKKLRQQGRCRPGIIDAKATA